MKDVLLDRSHGLPSGGRVRLRLARPLDRHGLTSLLADLGLHADDLDVRRALRCDFGRCWAIVATRWTGATEELAGFGTIAADTRAATVLAADPAVRRLLDDALASQLRAHERRVA